MRWEAVFLSSFLVFLVLRVPIAISLTGSSLIFLIGADISLQVIPQIMGMAFNSFVLPAIPLFMIAGELMNTGGGANRLFNFAQSLVGHIPGSLSHANVIASMIFAGMTGSAVADRAGLGVIEVKAMKDAGYDAGRGLCRYREGKPAKTPHHALGNRRTGRVPGFLPGPRHHGPEHPS